ncbi:pyrroline-5-carboxylate reductase [Pseudorhodoferax sp.]|uniref:pyrroline-5-carboxylate reductase n=1 Tax=Pseudorhodoferax sp. TaxID=1993553 RepID=UPI002DD62924|nr:pyrroline-5-carboxylate reductase [Pseudorhodoferax sp.]
MSTAPIAFIGGGNMASALIGGLVKAGRAPADILVIEPLDAQREKLAQAFGVMPLSGVNPALAAAGTIVWAVKPQQFAEAAQACQGLLGHALQVSVMAGVRGDALVQASGSPRVVRAMPNTPALIGRGIAGLHARPEVDAAARAEVERLFAPTGESLWVDEEDQLDAVTAVSGSGPAYFFYVLEAMTEAAVQMGLSAGQGRRLAQSTMAGAAALAQASPLSAAELRAQVTSKGGTTHAAITTLEAHGVGPAFVAALQAACRRAEELGRGG